MTPQRTRALLRALMHPIRATVEKYVHHAAEPVSSAELARALGLRPEIARYHLTALEHFGLITVDGDRARVRSTCS